MGCKCSFESYVSQEKVVLQYLWVKITVFLCKAQYQEQG